MGSPVIRTATWVGSVRSTWASLPSRAADAGVGVLSMYCASIALALFAFGFVLRGGTQLFGPINLTLVFLLATILCVGVHLWATREIRFQFIWADALLVGLALVMLANSSSAAGMEKGLRFVGLALAPYFLARVILIEFVRVKLFLTTILAAATVLGLGVVAFLTLPDAVANLLPYEIVEWNERLVFLKANPIQFGMFLMVGAMLYVGLMSGWRRIWIVPGLAMVGTLLYDMLIIGTRATLVTMFVTLLAAFLIALITRRFRNLPVLLVTLGATSFLFYTIFASAFVLSTTRVGEAGIRHEAGVWHEDEQKRVGEVISAFLVYDQAHRTDDDPPKRWLWQRADPLTDDANMPDNATWTDIDTYNIPTYEYTPTEDDRGKFLRAYVYYEKEGETYRGQTAAIGPIATAQQTTLAPADVSKDAQEQEDAIIERKLPQSGITLPNQRRHETLVLAVQSPDGAEEEKLYGHVIDNRLGLMEEALTKFRANPLLGAGTAGMDNYAHNIFAETAAELGLIGLALLLALLAFALRSLWKFFVKLDERNPYFHIITAVFLVASALFMQKQFSTNLAHHKDLIIFVAIILNLPLLLGMPSRESSGGLREKLPPRFRFLAPAKDSVPVGDDKTRP